MYHNARVKRATEVILWTTPQEDSTKPHITLLWSFPKLWGATTCSSKDGCNHDDHEEDNIDDDDDHNNDDEKNKNFNTHITYYV